MLKRVWKRKIRIEQRSNSFPGQTKTRQQDRGAAMVEMAFIFSILIMLLLGVTTSAIAFAQKNSVENSAREASRYAATYPPPSSEPDTPDTWEEWLADVHVVARAAAQGDLDESVDGYYICVAHTGFGQKLEDTTSTTLVTSGPGTRCYDDGLSDSRVQVVARRDTQINAALFSIDVTLDAPATARYEREE